MTISHRTHRWALTAATAAGLVVVTGSASNAVEVRGNFDQNGQYAELMVPANEQLARSNRSIAPELRLADYERAPYCREAAGIWVMGFADGACAPGADLAQTAVQCDEGDTMVMPMWMRTRATPTSPWSEWDDIDAGGCGIDLLPVMTEADFRRLPIPAPTLTMQPDRGWVLINIETITYTDSTPITLRTDLLGYGITVEATPTRWTYDYGDGHTLTTTSPGHTYPDHDVFHEYEHPGQAAITLTAEWTGRYQIDGNPTWRDINGTATTTTTTAPFTIEERTSRLVSDLCTDTPKPPDC
ncbi:PKD domain-containing protein [Cellulomonas wangsupingiae]|uniref:PKD domain-containing protein n=1 Tax=Cellulomonas wangsupingiae TaxID=2968085 RepID=A0ABY5K357_9CELL|nr:PKD domain-containing protein [Cellulomonas wangsupingiae]MCC2333619.1 PKD domain-containing protein [Cellulomonas wangsupingiae]UUI64887.1 PKD domain-containing protein [Cellulomonas wangsupingiae]